MSNNTEAPESRGMITGTTNYDDVPHVRCGICCGYYKADEPETHACQESHSER